MSALVKQDVHAIAPQGGRMAVSDIVSHVATVQEVMRAVMKPNVHYGTIPGTDKPTLYKAGAEVLSMTFRIADEYDVQDLSTSDMIRYRVTCTGRHQITGAVLGSGLGEASSGEEKYKWRKAVCREEWDETPPNMRRVKHAHGKNKTTYKVEQVRTEPSDLANTVLKMANKRAKMAMVLNVTAASDCFAQDLEDLDDTLREHLTGQEGGAGEPQAALPPYPPEKFAANLPEWHKLITSGRKTADALITMFETKNTFTDEQKAAIREKPAEPTAATNGADKPATPEIIAAMIAKATEMTISTAEICKFLKIDSLDGITPAQVDRALSYIDDPMGSRE